MVFFLVLLVTTTNEITTTTNMAAILTATVEAMTAITNNGASNVELETIVFEAVTVAPETIGEAEVISIVLEAV